MICHFFLPSYQAGISSFSPSILKYVNEAQMDKWAVSRQPEVPIIETGCRKVSHRKARSFLLLF